MSASVSSSDALTLDGIDVSHFQGTVDWNAVKGAGNSFAFAKATEGLNTGDPQFATNWEGIKAAGMTRGAYHFFHADEDAAAQAAHFLAAVTFSSGDLSPVLDVEVGEGVVPASIAADVKVWLDAVEQAVGVAPILYSDVSFIEGNLATGFSRYPLWLADYAETKPKAPGDWNGWTLWQRSQTGSVAGVSGDVDLDVYEGTQQAWDALLVP